MKKRMAVVLITVLLSGCAKTPLPSSPASGSQASQVISSAASSAASQTSFYTIKPDDMSAAAFLRQYFPLTDGSTSTIPLDAAVRSVIFNTGLEYETENVKHTTTFGSFERLLSGEVDLTYTVPLSAEQKQAAKDANIELETVPIAKEAFVFVLNAKNPVTSLTQKQLRGIYSGKITNWKQVGGNDAPIVAYQRNKTSGSQTYMTAFMGDTPLTEPPKTLVAESMGGLMDAIALYDNAENAIGYSVYAYAADMYGTGTELKFAAVDGIAPDDTTMTNGTYPLLSENYAIFWASEPQGSAARVLAEWLVTQDGQQAVANGGYIPYGVDPSTVVSHKNAWNKVGTGPKASGKATLPTSYYMADLSERYYIDGERVDGPYTVTILDENELNTTKYSWDYVVWNIRADFTGLVSAEKNAVITEFLNQSISELTAQRAEIVAYINEIGGRIGDQWHQNDQMQWYSAISIEMQCYNGWLSAAVFVECDGSEEDCIYDCKTAIFDLYTGKRVQFTDLFDSGTNIADGLNSAVNQYVIGTANWDMVYTRIKHENPIVTDEVITFTLNKIYYPRANHCFTSGVMPEFDIFTANSQVGLLRNMDGLWKSTVHVYQVALTESTGDMLRKNGVLTNAEKNFYAVQADDYVSQAAADKINAAMLAYIDEVHQKSLADYYNQTGMTRNELALYFEYWPDDVSKSSLNNFLDEHGVTVETMLKSGLCYNENTPFVICGKCVMYPRAGAYFSGSTGLDDSSGPLAFCLPKCLIFDIQTGEPIQLPKLYLNGWEKAAIWCDFTANYYAFHVKSETINAPDINDLVLVDLSWGYSATSFAVFMTQDGKMTYRAEVPGAYLNFD